MNRLAQVMVLALGCVVAGGCISLDEHRQLQMSHRTLLSEKAECEQALFDARAAEDNLRSKLSSTETELDTKGQLVSSLQSENDRLEVAFDSAQRTLENLADREISGPAVIERAILPEALDSALKQFSSQYPNAVEYNATKGTVKWKSDLLFALGSDVVKDTAQESLRRFADIMGSASAGDFDIVVVGHTDNVQIRREATLQRHPTNWHLSVHRAISVSDVLQNYGLSAHRIGVMGFGEYRPVASNDTEDGRARNRRVEIYIVPKGSIGSSVGA